MIAAQREQTTACWQALGTGVTLQVTQPAALEPARAIVEHELSCVDRALSRFREDSDLSRVNANAGRTVHVDLLLLDALEVAIRAAHLTDGVLTPTIGAALKLSGYDRDWTLLQPVDDSVHAAAVPTPAAVIAQIRDGWQAIELDRSRCTVRAPAGVQLDLGATAKAWAADRAAAAVQQATDCGVLVSLGGDIATAGGAPGGGWQIHVTDDHRSKPDAPGQRISIRSGGIATSSSTVRRWQHQGRAMHHIIDPATCQPAETIWRTVSVLAGDCTDANIASTTAVILGEAAPGWLQERQLPARLVDRDGEVTTVGGWPALQAQDRLR